ncbi:hypothetical protein QWJ07_03815 [Frankia sp. RB7]|nr:hypothetical protein [Frankia sp. RB7]
MTTPVERITVSDEQKKAVRNLIYDQHGIITSDEKTDKELTDFDTVYRVAVAFAAALQPQGWQPISEFKGEPQSVWEVDAEIDGVRRHLICTWLGGYGGFSIPGLCGFKVSHFREPRPLPPAPVEGR